VLKGGQEVPLANFAIQALARTYERAFFARPAITIRISAPSTMRLIIPPSNNPSMSGSRGRGRKAHEYAILSEREPNSRAPPQQRQMPPGPLAANARGVYGIEGLRLMTAASNIGDR